MIPKIVNIVLVRHGETVDNVKRVVQGHADGKLSETGKKQAEILGHALADEVFTRVYSSDLSRAFDTAAIVTSRSRTSPPNIVKDARLRERGFGVYEGLQVSVLQEEAKRLGITLVELLPEGAETLEQVTDRVVDFIQVLLDIYEGPEKADENVLVVTHGAWLKTLMVYLNTHPELFTLSNFDRSKVHQISGNTGVTRIKLGPIHQNGSPNMNFLSLYDVSHLREHNGTTVNDGV